MRLLKLRKLLSAFVSPTWFRSVFAHRVAPSIEHLGLLRRLRPATVIDVGANNGQFTLVTRRAAPQARIIALEPLAAAVRTFHAVTAGLADVTLLPVAAGRTRGEATIHVSAKADSSSLLPIGRAQVAAYPGTGQVRTETIRVDRLDTLVDGHGLARPVLLKIDVQGSEADVLHGAAGLLEHLDFIFCECSYRELYTGQALVEDVVSLLAAQGFALRGVYNQSTDAGGVPIQADFLFAKGRRASA